MNIRSLRPTRHEPISVGPMGEPFLGVHRIVVLRAGGLGDLLIALPAIESLRVAYPDAEIVLLGSALQARLLDDRPSPVDEVVVLPESELGGGAAKQDDRAWLAWVRRTPVDLAVQLHGDGAQANPLLNRLGARWTVGSAAARVELLQRNVPFRYYQNETMRALEVASAAGAPPVALEPRIEVTTADLAAADRILDRPDQPVVAIHPGARDPRRRWSVSNFATIAADCVGEGIDVVLVGTADELGLLEAVATEARALGPLLRNVGVQQLAGVDLSTLCGVLARSVLFVGNDSGPRHLAHAVGTATVGIFWVGNVTNAGPIARTGDRVLISWCTECPSCGSDLIDETQVRCAHEESIVNTVPVEAVRAEVDDLLSAGAYDFVGRNDYLR